MDNLFSPVESLGDGDTGACAVCTGGSITVCACKIAR